MNQVTRPSLNVQTFLIQLSALYQNHVCNDTALKILPLPSWGMTEENCESPLT